MNSSAVRRLAGLLAVVAILGAFWFVAWSSVATRLGIEAQAQRAAWQRGESPWNWNFAQGRAVVWPGSSGFESDRTRVDALVGRISARGADLSLALAERQVDLGILDHATLDAATSAATHVVLIADTPAGTIVFGRGVVSNDGQSSHLSLTSPPMSAQALRLRLEAAPGTEVALRELRLVPRGEVRPRDCAATEASIDCDARVPVLRAPPTPTPEIALLWRDQQQRQRPAAIVQVASPAFEWPALGQALRRALNGATGWLLMLLPVVTLIASYAPLGSHPRTRAALELTGVFGPWLLLQWASVEPDAWIEPRGYAVYWCSLVACIALRDPTPNWRWLGSRPAWRAATQFMLVAGVVVAAAGVASGFDGNGFQPRRIESDMYWRYPLWALVQQWILLRAIAPRMRALFGSELASGIAVGALFGLLHVPNFGLMVATFAAGSAWAVLGYRHRALLPLALSHVVLGLTLFAVSPPWLLRSAEIGARFLMLP